MKYFKITVMQPAPIVQYKCWNQSNHAWFHQTRYISRFKWQTFAHAYWLIRSLLRELSCMHVLAFCKKTRLMRLWSLRCFSHDSGNTAMFWVAFLGDNFKIHLLMIMHCLGLQSRKAHFTFAIFAVIDFHFRGKWIVYTLTYIRTTVYLLYN